MPVDPLILGGLIVIAVVVIALVLRQRSEGVTTVSTPSTPTPSPTSTNTASTSAPGADLEVAVRSLLSRKQKIEAVKLVRVRTGLGLRESKDYVDAIERGLSPIAPPIQAPPPQLTSENLDQQIRDLLARNQKIVAVKLVRQHTGLGLKEALDYVERVERQ